MHYDHKNSIVEDDHMEDVSSDDDSDHLASNSDIDSLCGYADSEEDQTEECDEEVKDEHGAPRSAPYSRAVA
ncbi:hypothetical protein A4X13_0g7823, partial [Tilletia indica]